MILNLMYVWVYVCMHLCMYVCIIIIIIIINIIIKYTMYGLLSFEKLAMVDRWIQNKLKNIKIEQTHVRILLPTTFNATAITVVTISVIATIVTSIYESRNVSIKIV